MSDQTFVDINDSEFDPLKLTVYLDRQAEADADAEEFDAETQVEFDADDEAEFDAEFDADAEEFDAEEFNAAAEAEFDAEEFDAADEEVGLSDPPEENLAGLTPPPKKEEPVVRIDPDDVEAMMLSYPTREEIGIDDAEDVDPDVVKDIDPDDVEAMMLSYPTLEEIGIDRKQIAKRESTAARLAFLGPVGGLVNVDDFFAEGTNPRSGVGRKGKRELSREDIVNIRIAYANREDERKEYVAGLVELAEEEKARLVEKRKRIDALPEIISEDTEYTDPRTNIAGYRAMAKKIDDDERHIDNLLKKSKEPYELGVSGLDFEDSLYPSRNMFRPSKDGLRMLSTNKEFLENFLPYIYDRWGPEEAKLESETMEEFVHRGLSLWRWEMTNTWSNANGLWYAIDNAENPEQLARMKNVQLILENDEIVPTMFDRGFGETIDAGSDYLMAGFSDPLNLAGLGVGKLIGFAGKWTAQNYAKAFPKSVANVLSSLTTPSIVALEAGAGVWFDDIEQRKEILANVRDQNLSRAMQEKMSKDINEGRLSTSETIAIAEAVSPRKKGETLEEYEARGGQVYNSDRALMVGVLSGAIGGPLAVVGANQLSKTRFWNKRSNKIYEDRVAADTERKIARQKVAPLKEDIANGEQDQIAKNKRIMEEEVPSTEILEADLKLAISERMTDVVRNLLKIYDQDPNLNIGDIIDFHPDMKTMEKIQEITNKILRDEGEINLDALDRAVQQTGMTTPEYVKFLTDGLTGRGGAEAGDLALAQKTLTSQSGSVLNKAKQISDMFKKFKDIDPRVSDEIEKMFGAPNRTENSIRKAMRIANRFMDEGIAWVVSAPATAIRNVGSGVSLITFGTAANLIETSLYHMGKAYTSALDGTASFRGVQAGLADMARDTFGTMLILLDPTTAKNLSDAALGSNPRLNRVISRSLQETGEANLFAITRLMNSFNLIGDVFIRRAVFGSSVDQQLRRGASSVRQNMDEQIEALGRELVDIGTPQGANSAAARQSILEKIAALRADRESIPTSLSEVISSGKDVPINALERGVQEALKVTMAYKPRSQIKGGAQTAGEVLETLGGTLVNVVNKQELFGVAKIPFAFIKFMVNAMSWQLRHTYVNQVSGAFGMVSEMSSAYTKSWKKGKLLKDKINITKDINQAEMGLARRQFAEGTVGVAALLAAIYERANNQDIPFTHSRLGTEVVDTLANWPYNFIKAIADVIVKTDLGEAASIDKKELIEAVTNYQGRSIQEGGHAFDQLLLFITDINDVGEIWEEAAAVRLAKTITGIASRFFTWTKVSKDVDIAVNDEEAVIRDRNQRDFATQSGFWSTFTAQLKDEAGNMLPDFSNTELPPKYDAVTGKLIKKEVGFPFKHLTGMTKVERPDIYKGELDRKKLRSFMIVKSAGPGLGKYDNAVKRLVSETLPQRITDIVTTDGYKQLTPARQTRVLKNEIQEVKSEAIDRIAFEPEFQGISDYVINRKKWVQLSTLERNAINELFIQENINNPKLEGLSIEEASAETGTGDFFMYGSDILRSLLDLDRYN